MLIEINTADTNRTELTALRALIGALLGETSPAAIALGTDADRPLDVKPAAAPVSDGAAATLPDGEVVTLKAVVPLPPAPSESAAVVPPPPATNGAPAAPPPPAGVDVDADGLPWDGRIHPEGKVKNADGKWRQKRKVDAAVVASVTAELRQALAAPPAPTDTPTVTDPAAAFGAPPPPPPPPPAEPSADPTAGAVVASTVAPSTPAEADTGGTPFAKFMGKVAAMQAQGKLTTELLHNIIAQFGLPPSVMSLMTRPDLLPAVEAALPAA